MAATNHLSRVVGSYLLNAANYAGGEIADASKFARPLLERGAAPAWATKDGVQGLLMPSASAAWFEVVNPLIPHGSVVAVFSIDAGQNGSYHPVWFGGVPFTLAASAGDFAG